MFLTACKHQTRSGLLVISSTGFNTVGNASDGTDSFSYDVAVGATVYPSRYTTFEEKTVKPVSRADRQPRSGVWKNTLFVSPGVQLILLQNLALEFLFPGSRLSEIQGCTANNRLRCRNRVSVAVSVLRSV